MVAWLVDRTSRARGRSVCHVPRRARRRAAPAHRLRHARAWATTARMPAVHRRHHSTCWGIACRDWPPSTRRRTAKGCAHLRDAGIEVTTAVCEDAAKALVDGLRRKHFTTASVRHARAQGRRVRDGDGDALNTKVGTAGACVRVLRMRAESDAAPTARTARDDPCPRADAGELGPGARGVEAPTCATAAKARVVRDDSVSKPTHLRRPTWRRAHREPAADPAEKAHRMCSAASTLNMQLPCARARLLRRGALVVEADCVCAIGALARQNQVDCVVDWSSVLEASIRVRRTTTIQSALRLTTADVVGEAQSHPPHSSHCSKLRHARTQATNCLGVSMASSARGQGTGAWTASAPHRMRRRMVVGRKARVAGRQTAQEEFRARRKSKKFCDVRNDLIVRACRAAFSGFASSCGGAGGSGRRDVHFETGQAAMKALLLVARSRTSEQRTAECVGVSPARSSKPASIDVSTTTCKALNSQATASELEGCITGKYYAANRARLARRELRKRWPRSVYIKLVQRPKRWEEGRPRLTSTSAPPVPRQPAARRGRRRPRYRPIARIPGHVHPLGSDRSSRAALPGASSSVPMSYNTNSVKGCLTSVSIAASLQDFSRSACRARRRNTCQEQSVIVAAVTALTSGSSTTHVQPRQGW